MRRTFRLSGARELDDEVRFHVEMRAKVLEAAGLSSEDAYAEALRKFGDVTDLRDYCDSLRVSHMRRERRFDIAQDVRFALRQFRKWPGFAAVAALTLALGVGATTAIFTVVNGVVLQPLPFDHPQQIVQLWGLDANGQHIRFADPTFDHLAAENRTLSAVAEYTEYGMSLAEHGEVVRVHAALVSKQFFDVFRLKPAMGRFFVSDEQRIGAPSAVVISYRFWLQEFGGSPLAIGATLRNGSTPMTIVGVLHAGQEFPADADIWSPREQFEEDASYTAHNWHVIGRIRDGVTPAQASSDVSMLLRRLHTAVGDATWTFDGVAVTLREQIVGRITPLLLLILAASGLLLLIACANVANLLIARIAARENEIAVRLALGAGQARLAQQLLIEASLLSAIGCAGGLVIAVGGMRVLLALRPALIPRVGELRLDWRVLVFAMAISAGMALALGLLAAWRAARGDLRAALAQSTRTHGGGGAAYRIRGSLVVVQLAMTVVLLVGAGLLAKSFARLMMIDPGFRTHGLVIAATAHEHARDSAGIVQRARFFDALAEQAREIPGVTGVGVSDAPPFSGGTSNGDFVILPSANVKPTWNDKSHLGWANYSQAGPGYFEVMGIPLLSGRVFDDHDRLGNPDVAVINAALAKKQWPNENPIGKLIDFGNIDGDMTPLTIVGVVGDVRNSDLALEPEPTVYVCYRQRTSNGEDAYVIMSSLGEAPVMSAARRTFRRMPVAAPMRFETVEDIIGQSVASQRFMLLLVGVFGAVALLLATLGVYSVISYLVVQRSREISIRVALGATAPEVVGLILGQGVALSLLGAVAGGLGALAATRVLEHLLYQVSTTDPAAFAAVLVVLCLVALLASYLPARRAARLAPMDVLRGA
jgi:putative ABC transport system permease protein